jgi:hypothetical protein
VASAAVVAEASSGPITANWRLFRTPRRTLAKLGKLPSKALDISGRAEMRPFAHPFRIKSDVEKRRFSAELPERGKLGLRVKCGSLVATFELRPSPNVHSDVKPLCLAQPLRER